MKALQIAIIAILFLSHVPAFTQEQSEVKPRKLSFWFNLGYQYLGSSGLNSQYEAGINDFPVTPAHAAPHARFLVGYRFLEKTEFLLDMTMYATTKVTKIDPSDGDEIKVETASRFSASLSAHHYLKEGVLNHYLSLGLGIDQIDGEPYTLSTKYGYSYVVEQPVRETDLFTAVGIGSQLKFDEMLKAFVDLRLLCIFDADGPVFAVSSSVGVGFYF